MKSYVLPARKDQVGHHFLIRNQLTGRDDKYLNKTPEFNVCKKEVFDKIIFIWVRGGLPVIGRNQSKAN